MPNFFTNFFHTRPATIPDAFQVNTSRAPSTHHEVNLNDGLRIVYDPNGAGKALRSQVNRGGEGVVYKVEGLPSVVVKIFSRPQHAAENTEKLKAMMNMPSLKDHSGLAWPRMPVLDRPGGTLIGFGMRRAQGYSLHTLGNPVLIREKLPRWRRQDSVKVCLSLLERLESLHRENVLVGDLNPGNLMFDPGKKEVICIDCDSYQVPRSGGGSYLCPVGVQHFMAPEALDLDWRRTPRTLEQEHFAMAILVFRILMLGAHPYACVQGEDPVQNLRQGLCPLGTGTGLRLPRGPWYNIWSHLPFRLKSLFIQTFRDGHRNPHLRPTSQGYMDALKEYHWRIGQGQFTDDLIPRTPKLPQSKSSTQPQHRN